MCLDGEVAAYVFDPCAKGGVEAQSRWMYAEYQTAELQYMKPQHRRHEEGIEGEHLPIVQQARWRSL